MDYQELIDRHMLIAMDKQLHAADVLGDRGFAADLDRGVLAFGDDLETRAELVGSEAPDRAPGCGRGRTPPDTATTCSRAPGASRPSARSTGSAS